jgi:hypothetical protein
MFADYKQKGSIWKQNVNSLLGSIFLGTVALWAALFMLELQWGTNPIVDAFTKVVESHTTLPE